MSLPGRRQSTGSPGATGSAGDLITGFFRSILLDSIDTNKIDLFAKSKKF